MTQNKWLQNQLDCPKLTSKDEIRHEQVLYLRWQPKEFYKQGIYKLVDRWNEIQGSNEVYVND